MPPKATPGIPKSPIAQKLAAVTDTIESNLQALTAAKQTQARSSAAVASAKPQLKRLTKEVLADTVGESGVVRVPASWRRILQNKWFWIALAIIAVVIIAIIIVVVVVTRKKKTAEQTPAL